MKTSYFYKFDKRIKNGNTTIKPSQGISIAHKS
jgi:hypothetical protein